MPRVAEHTTEAGRDRREADRLAAAFRARLRPWAAALPGRRELAAALLVIGLLTIPVNCALAEGPHSLFVPPTAVATSQMALHHHHGAGSGAPLPWRHRPLDPVPGVPAADELPTPATALTALAAVTSDDGPADTPAPEAVLPAEQTAPAGLHPRLDVPPPRS